jgi:hypothetical protein
MRCGNFGCNAELYPGDLFCGRCGQTVSTYQSGKISETYSDLFPLWGITLGETKVNQLASLGKRAARIDKNTGKPYDYYEINNINFWYNANGIACSIYIARGIYQIPVQWNALGFSWDISYNQWMNLLTRLGYRVITEEPPQIVQYDGHNSLSAKISATKQARIPIEIQLNFNYNRGTTTDSLETLYSISVKALNVEP